MELKKKKIIVSGCAKGMGEATLNSYVKAGAHVIGMDIDSELGQTVAENANKNDEGRSCASRAARLPLFSANENKNDIFCYDAVPCELLSNNE